MNILNITSKTEAEATFASVLSQSTSVFHTNIATFTTKLDRTSAPSTKISMLTKSRANLKTEMATLATAFKIWDKEEELNNTELLQAYMDHYHTLRSTYFTQDTHILLLQQVSPIQNMQKSILAHVCFEINDSLMEYHDKCYDLPIVTASNIDIVSVDTATQLTWLIGLFKSDKYAGNLSGMIKANKVNKKDTKYIKKIALEQMDKITTYMAGDLSRKGYQVAMQGNTPFIIPIAVA